MSKLIYWTLQNDCPQIWKDKFFSLNFTIHHSPLIKLCLTNKYFIIPESVNKFDALIVSSKFSAQNVTNILKEKKIPFYAVGKYASRILQDAGHEVLHISENSEDLAQYLKENTTKKILHLCSEKSNVELWPPHVKTLPFYKPVEDTEFNLPNDHIDDNSIVVFGSPSGVDMWFTKDVDSSSMIFAAMGKTTANRFISYMNKSIITPESSTIDDLCKAIYNQLKVPHYEEK